MTEHTPGPWRKEIEPPFGIVIRADAKDDYPVAIVSSYFGGDENPRNEECHANGELMAAAPDLLEAAQEALAEFDRVFNSDRPAHALMPWMRKLHTAIAKATDQRLDPSIPREE